MTTFSFFFCFRFYAPVSLSETPGIVLCWEDFFPFRISISHANFVCICVVLSINTKITFWNYINRNSLIRTFLEPFQCSIPMFIIFLFSRFVAYKIMLNLNNMSYCINHITSHKYRTSAHTSRSYPASSASSKPSSWSAGTRPRDGFSTATCISGTLLSLLRPASAEPLASSLCPRR